LEEFKQVHVDLYHTSHIDIDIDIEIVDTNTYC
jgi:hypothetical protein